MRQVEEDRRAVRRARVAVTSAFAAHAILSGLLGPWIPHLKERAGLDPAGLGLALTGFAVGLVTGTRLAGPAVRRLGGRAAVRVGVPVLAVGFALLPVGTDLPSLSLIFLGIGLLAGLVDVAMNIEAVAVERRFERRVMTSIHGTWSVSVFVGAAAASLGVAAGIPIGVFLPISAVFVAAASFSVLRWLPVAATARPETDATAPRERSDRVLLLLCLVAGGSFLMEGIAIEWSAVFLRESVGVEQSIAGLGVVAFSAGMAVSRFVGDRIVARVGQPVVVRVGASSAFLAFGVMLLVPTAATSVVAFGVVGLGLGPVVPLAFRSAGSIETPHRRSALPIVVTAGYVGSIVGPLVVGFIADGFGLRVAFLVPLVAVAAAAFAAAATRESTAQPTSPSTDS